MSDAPAVCQCFRDTTRRPGYNCGWLDMESYRYGDIHGHVQNFKYRRHLYGQSATRMSLLASINQESRSESERLRGPDKIIIPVPGSVHSPKEEISIRFKFAIDTLAVDLEKLLEMGCTIRGVEKITSLLVYEHADSAYVKSPIQLTKALHRFSGLQKLTLSALSPEFGLDKYGTSANFFGSSDEGEELDMGEQFPSRDGEFSNLYDWMDHSLLDVKLQLFYALPKTMDFDSHGRSAALEIHTLETLAHPKWVASIIKKHFFSEEQLQWARKRLGRPPIPTIEVVSAQRVDVPWKKNIELRNKSQDEISAFQEVNTRVFISSQEDWYWLSPLSEFLKLLPFLEDEELEGINESWAIEMLRENY